MLDIHRPYPGVAMAVGARGSVLFGAPADAFKATKAYCQRHNLPFPRVLVAPQRLLAGCQPQFAPEFFLYDFLFVHGAAFKPDLRDERLTLVLDAEHVGDELRALSITLDGPSRADLAGYQDGDGRALIDPQTVASLAGVSEHMAIKKDGRPRRLDEMVAAVAFDRNGVVELLDATVRVERTGPTSFRVRGGKGSEGAVDLDLAFDLPVVPFATLPVPSAEQTPATFAVKPLGTRSGFDLSGPTTGFLLWLNGRAVIYDGPVGTRYLLEHQGIAPGDVAAVVLSHCHEDHMGAFLDLVLGGRKPRLFTAEPIYRSMLQKLSHHLGLTEPEVASYLDYERVTPGTPVEAFGATFDFFYTIHSIPTIGMTVTMRGPGTVHRVQISGDTLGHDGLDSMKAAGVLDGDTHARMRNLVPARLDQGAVYFADVGEAIIHGNPKDWQGNPNRILYYHCPDDAHTREFGHGIAQAGTTYTLIEPPRFHPAVPGRLLQALAFMDFTDPAWLAAFLHRGRTRRAAPDEVLVGADAPGDCLSVIISGSAEVSDADGALQALLKPGDLFGAIEFVMGERRQHAVVRAVTPMEIFDIDGALCNEYVEATGQHAALTRAWSHRCGIDSARLFRSLDGAAKSRIAALATAKTYKAGEAIYQQGATGDDFFLLIEGRVALEVDGHAAREIDAGDHDNFFGETATIAPNRRRSTTVTARTPARLLRLPGRELRRLAADETAVRYVLEVALAQP